MVIVKEASKVRDPVLQMRKYAEHRTRLSEPNFHGESERLSRLKSAHIRQAAYPCWSNICPTFDAEDTAMQNRKT